MLSICSKLGLWEVGKRHMDDDTRKSLQERRKLFSWVLLFFFLIKKCDSSPSLELPLLSVNYSRHKSSSRHWAQVAEGWGSWFPGVQCVRMRPGGFWNQLPLQMQAGARQRPTPAVFPSIACTWLACGPGELQTHP